MWDIKIIYKTGNSFGTHTKTDYIEHDWSDISMARESLRRIANHYRFYVENGNIWSRPKDSLLEGVIWDEEYNMIGLELVDNNGETFRTSAFWTGYFERLDRAEITLAESDNIFFEPISH